MILIAGLHPRSPVDAIFRDLEMINAVTLSGDNSVVAIHHTPFRGSKTRYLVVLGAADVGHISKFDRRLDDVSAADDNSFLLVIAKHPELSSQTKLRDQHLGTPTLSAAAAKSQSAKSSLAKPDLAKAGSYQPSLSNPTVAQKTKASSETATAQEIDATLDSMLQSYQSPQTPAPSKKLSWASPPPFMSITSAPQQQPSSVTRYSPQNFTAVLNDHEDKLRTLQASVDQLKASVLTKSDLKSVLREYDEEKKAGANNSA